MGYFFFFRNMGLSVSACLHKLLGTSNAYCTISIYLSDNGYPHDGRADKNPYPHERRADKDSYPPTAIICALS